MLECQTARELPGEPTLWHRWESPRKPLSLGSPLIDRGHYLLNIFKANCKTFLPGKKQRAEQIENGGMHAAFTVGRCFGLALHGRAEFVVRDVSSRRAPVGSNVGACVGLPGELLICTPGSLLPSPG